MRYIILFFLVFNLSCSRKTEYDLPYRENMPDQESWGVKIILTDEGVVRAKVRSGHLQKYNKKEFIMLDSNVTVDFYNNVEKHTSTLTSNIAEINESSNNMKAIGNVKVVSDSGITLYSETLNWNSKDEKLLTKDNIMITTIDYDTLYGIGFESDSDLKNWKILKPFGVTGKKI